MESIKTTLLLTCQKQLQKNYLRSFIRSQRPEYDPYEDPNTTTEIDRISRLIFSAQLMLQIGNVKGFLI